MKIMNDQSIESTPLTITPQPELRKKKTKKTTSRLAVEEHVGAVPPSTNQVSAVVP